jgi:mRNA-degrading endonuclease toxin of MazEF toxin-antitoxin module
MRRGDIYLADFGKSRDSFAFGKKRPVVIFQTDKLNYAIEEGLYSHVLVIPLSTQDDILTQEFRLKISARENLKQDSYLVCNSICFLHVKFLEEKIASLYQTELQNVEKILKELFELES